MGTLTRFADKLIFVDTMPFIYHIEEHPVYVETVEAFFVGALRDKNYRLMTSVITLAEVLVQPYRKDNDVLVAEYEGIICDTDELLVVPIDRIASRKAARLRADYSLKTPDALQLASSLVHGADYFLTNDKGIAKAGLPQIILLDDLL
jgi:predicted nucleic acid-binding protein